jgi:hypothetical protein
MEFKKCQVGNKVFGNPTQDDITNDAAKEYQGMIQSSADECRTAMDWYFKE